MVTPERIDATALKCSNKNWVETGSRFNHDFARAIEAEVRKDDESLIRQMLEALDECAEDSATVVNDYVQAYGENHRPLRLKAMRDTVTKAKDALAAARARLEKAP